MVGLGPTSSPGSELFVSGWQSPPFKKWRNNAPSASNQWRGDSVGNLFISEEEIPLVTFWFSPPIKTHFCQFLFSDIWDGRVGHGSGWTLVHELTTGMKVCQAKENPGRKMWKLWLLWGVSNRRYARIKLNTWARTHKWHAKQKKITENCRKNVEALTSLGSFQSPICMNQVEHLSTNS